jgi:hypothetical protein
VEQFGCRNLHSSPQRKSVVVGWFRLSNLLRHLGESRDPSLRRSDPNEFEIRALAQWIPGFRRDDGRACDWSIDPFTRAKDALDGVHSSPDSNLA